jgi:glycosyltransferase involved in cell wall biosynthesis
MAILEALACRLPCVITTACHFAELARCKGGIVVTPDVGGLTDGLRELFERSPRERARLGQNGRRLVEDHYTWDRQGARLAAVYDWLTGGGSPPEAVVS